MARTAKKLLTIYQGGVLLIADASSINFTGAGVSGTLSGTDVTETISGSGGGGGTPVTNEIVAGSGNSWTLAFTPISGSVVLFAEGQYLIPGAGNDYTISGDAISTVNSYPAGSVAADYSK